MRRLRRHAPLQRPELHVRLERAHRVLPGAPLERPEVGRVERHLDALRDGGGHLRHGRLFARLLVGRLREGTAPEGAVLLDVGGTLLRLRCLVNVLLLALVELKTFEVWEFLAGSPTNEIGLCHLISFLNSPLVNSHYNFLNLHFYFDC